MAFEDYTTFTETDPGSDITVATNKIDWTTCAANVDARVMKSYGASYFDDFEHQLSWEITYSANFGVMNFWALSNSNDNIQDIRDASGDLLRVTFYRDVAVPTLYLVEDTGGSTSSDTTTSISENTQYCFTIDRNGTTLTCYIYSNSARTTLVDTLQLTTFSTAMQYLYGMGNQDTGGTADTTGYVEDLDIGLDESSSNSSSSDSSSTDSSSTDSSSTDSSSSSSESSASSSSSSSTDSSSSSSTDSSSSSTDSSSSSSSSSTASSSSTDSSSSSTDSSSSSSSTDSSSSSQSDESSSSSTASSSSTDSSSSSSTASSSSSSQSNESSSSSSSSSTASSSSTDSSSSSSTDSSSTDSSSSSSSSESMNESSSNSSSSESSSSSSSSATDDEAENYYDDLIREHGEPMTLKRRTITNTRGNRVHSWGSGESIYGWLQPLSRNTEAQGTRIRYERREVHIIAKIFIAVNPNISEGDRIETADNNYIVRGVTDQAGLGRLWRLDVQEVLS